jgi:hypothetical protein
LKTPQAQKFFAELFSKKRPLPYAPGEAGPSFCEQKKRKNFILEVYFWTDATRGRPAASACSRRNQPFGFMSKLRHWTNGLQRRMAPVDGIGGLVSVGLGGRLCIIMGG